MIATNLSPLTSKLGKFAGGDVSSKVVPFTDDEQAPGDVSNSKLLTKKKKNDIIAQNSRDETDIN